jgi:hypothetical protein
VDGSGMGVCEEVNTHDPELIAAIQSTKGAVILFPKQYILFL